MGLLKKISISGGQLTIENAYLKIGFYTGNKLAQIHLEAYVDKVSSDSGKPPLDTYSYNFAPTFGDNAEDIKRQGYKYLKTLPEYESAIDC